MKSFIIPSLLLAGFSDTDLKFFKTYNDNGEYKDLINETVWQEIQNKR